MSTPISSTRLKNPVRVNRTRLQAGKGLAKLSSTLSTSFSYTLNNNTFKRKNDKDKKGSDKKGKNGDDTDSDDPMSNAPNADRDPRGNIDNDIDLSSDGYMKWDVPWNLSFNYSIGYAYGKFNKRKMDYDGKITQNLSFSGNIRPTANWNFSFSASYNFETHKIAYMNCNITRDLHCFSMRASFVPVGSVQILQLPHFGQLLAAAGCEIRQTLIYTQRCHLVLIPP